MVNNATNINKTKESLNSDGQQFHQYQQNEQPTLSSNNLFILHTYMVGNINVGQETRLRI
jgi:hypothetical protein